MMSVSRYVAMLCTILAVYLSQYEFMHSASDATIKYCAVDLASIGIISADLHFESNLKESERIHFHSTVGALLP